MNKSTNNMYAFVTHTYNPIKSRCPHACSYCYMEAINHRFKLDPELRLDEKELAASLGKNKVVFVGSSTDMWAKEVPSEWIGRVYDHLLAYPENVYLLQSKNPQRFLEFIGHPLMTDHKEGLILATTIETNRQEQVSATTHAPAIESRVAAIQTLNESGYKTMLTLEPIMDFDQEEIIGIVKAIRPFQVNIGCNSNRAITLIEPSQEKLITLIAELKQITKVHIKSNASRIIKTEAI